MKHYNVTISIYDTDNWQDRSQEDLRIPADMMDQINWRHFVQLILEDLLKEQAARQAGEVEAGVEDGN
jgi:hypothetical protein